MRGTLSSTSGMAAASDVLCKARPLTSCMHQLKAEWLGRMSVEARQSWWQAQTRPCGAWR